MKTYDLPVEIHQVGAGWSGDCKLCTEHAFDHSDPVTLKARLVEHAKKEHYDYASDAYYDAKELEEIRGARRRSRAVFGSDDVARQMNREGL